MSFVPWSLRQLLGSNAHDVTEDALRNLLDLHEGDELDFKKQPHDRDGNGPRNLGVDVASFANHKGGLIIVGIAESPDGGPFQLTRLPMESLDGEGLRILQTVTNWVTPAVSGLQVVPIRGDQGGYLLVSIPRSVRRPHAVVVGDNLLYPIRDGARNRYLSESEVADLYRSRFEEAAGQVGILGKRHDLLVGKLNLSSKAWITTTLQPNIGGSMQFSREFATSLGEWIRPRLDSFPGIHNSVPGFEPSFVHGGFRSYRFSDKEPDPHCRFGILHLDGGGSVAYGWNCSEDTSQIKIFPEDVVAAIVNSLNLLASWATQRAGTDGDAAVFAQLHTPNCKCILWRDTGITSSQIPNTCPLVGVSSIADLTLDLAAILDNGRDLLLAARGLTEDLLSGFEFIEPDQIDREGSLRIKYFPKRQHDKLRDWAGAHKTVTTEEVL